MADHQNPRPRRLTRCHRHPDIPTTTGLCAPCLHHRLSLLNASASSSAVPPPPQLRRSKSYSANKPAVSSFEPRRRSCDVRARGSLSSLFDIDDDDDVIVEVPCTVPEVREEEELDSDCHSRVCDTDCRFKEARVCDFPGDNNNDDEFEESNTTMKEFIDLELGTKPNNKPGNGGSTIKEFKEIAGSFWIAASVFSKKVQKWRKKEKRSKSSKGSTSRRDNGGGCDDADGNGVVGLGEMRLENLRGRRLRDTQSEVGEYGFGRSSCDADPRGSLDWGRASVDVGALGRRSCDSDPRFSIDLGRASIDCGRISVDESRGEFDAPRASWDGYLMGGRTVPRGNSVPVVSVIENAMASVYGFDHRVLGDGKVKVESNEDERVSGGSHVMKEQYLDGGSLLRRTKGLDQSKSLRRDVALKEDGEAKSIPSGRVSTSAIGIFDGTKLLITEKELNEWRLRSKSLKDDSSESFETASKDLASVTSSSNGQGFKKCRQWSKLWSIWGLLHRKKGDKYGYEENPKRGNMERTRADSADINPRNGYGEAGSNPEWKLTRSHSTASSRCSSTVGGSVRETKSRNESQALVRRRQDDAVLERNRSAKFSSNNLDNGLLRFYLTPLRSRRRSKLGKSRSKNSRSLARSVLRL